MSCDLIKIQEDIDYWEEVKRDAMDQLAYLTKESLFFKRSQNGEDSVEVQDIDKSITSVNSILNLAQDKLDTLNKLKNDCSCGTKKQTHLGRWGYGY